MERVGISVSVPSALPQGQCGCHQIWPRQCCPSIIVSGVLPVQLACLCIPFARGTEQHIMICFGNIQEAAYKASCSLASNLDALSHYEEVILKESASAEAVLHLCEHVICFRPCGQPVLNDSYKYPIKHTGDSEGSGLRVLHEAAITPSLGYQAYASPVPILRDWVTHYSCENLTSVVRAFFPRDFTRPDGISSRPGALLHAMPVMAWQISRQDASHFMPLEGIWSSVLLGIVGCSADSIATSHRVVRW